MSSFYMTQRCRHCANLKRGQTNWCRARGMAIKDSYVRCANSCAFYEFGGQEAFGAGRREAVLAEKAAYERRKSE